MIRTSLLLAGAGCWIAAAVVGGASADGAVAWGRDLARPVVLPFLWRTLEDAARSGDPAEAFAKAQLLLEALPGWADGHTVFAYRYALDGGDTPLPAPARARAAHERLQVALAVLDRARPSCRGHEIDLLESMAFLVELAARRQPGLDGLLGDDPAAFADRYLEQAERIGAGPQVREQRIFLAPRVAAALLRAGDSARALDVLDATIARCGEIRDRELGAEWQATLTQVRRRLGGETVDLAALRADQRLAPLLPFLR